MCHMSHVMCHMSGLRFQVSSVRYQVFFCFFLQCGGASRWRVCYQRGLPHLVLVFKCFLLAFIPTVQRTFRNPQTSFFASVKTSNLDILHIHFKRQLLPPHLYCVFTFKAKVCIAGFEEKKKANLSSIHK